MVIDGGKGQLSSTLKALGNNKDIRVVALAKRNNELFSPGRTNPVLLKNLPQEVSNLLLHIRDEAHRFAITFHRKLRKVDAIGTS
jgi:excinuclease ABC subunit C